jgi:hypothetical protein
MDSVQQATLLIHTDYLLLWFTTDDWEPITYATITEMNIVIQFTCTVTSYFPMLWAVRHTLMHYSTIVIGHQFLNATYIALPHVQWGVFTPTFITVSDPQITTTFSFTALATSYYSWQSINVHSAVDLEAWVMLQHSCSVLLWPHLWQVL